MSTQEDQLNHNKTVFDLFAEDKITLREGVIRVLEQEINPIALLANANPDVGIESDIDQEDEI